MQSVHGWARENKFSLSSYILTLNSMRSPNSYLTSITSLHKASADIILKSFIEADEQDQQITIDFLT